MSRTAGARVVIQGRSTAALSSRRAHSSNSASRTPAAKLTAARKLKSPKGSLRRVPPAPPTQSSVSRHKRKPVKPPTPLRSPPPPKRLGDDLHELVSQDAFAESAGANEIRLVAGRSGDHAAVYHTLLAIFQGPSRNEFQL